MTVYVSTGLNVGLCGPVGRHFPVDPRNTDLVREIERTGAAKVAVDDAPTFNGAANGWQGDSRVDYGDVAPARSAPWPGIQPP